MKLPFTTQEFLQVFENYNNAVFPMQMVLYLLAAIAIFFIFKKTPISNKIITLILGFFWLWMGIFYHLTFFTVINKAAYLFGMIFILQSILLLWKGVFKNKLSFSFSKNLNCISGIVLIAFALIFYPVLGYSLGHIYPANPTFGLPCPTTIFTFGMLLITDKKHPFIILIIPFFWAIIGFMAAISLGITEDISLLITALAAMVLLNIRNKKVLSISGNKNE
jgi:hypothetical protein